MDPTDEQRLVRLVFAHRWGALATSQNDQPLASYVAYAAETTGDGFLIHVSRLASHTQNLLVNPQASLVISEVDRGTGDPQTLARVTLQGRVTEIAREAASYEVARREYLTVLPESQQLFGFADFVLFRFIPAQVRFIAGFGKAYTLSPETLQQLRHAHS